MTRRSRALFATPLVVASFTTAAAQRPADSTAMPRVIITATRLPVPTGATTAVATTISGDELRAAGVTDLITALRGMPGLTVARLGSSGAQASLFLRGGESDYVRVLVDGVPVNDPGGAFDFSSLSTDNIDRIEVVRGPVSVLYGSDAMTGVVQIFTRAGVRGSEWDADARAGNLGGRDASLAWRGGTALARASAALATHRTDGALPFNNQYRDDVASARLTLTPAVGTIANASLRWTADDYHYPTDGAGRVEDTNAYRSGDRIVAAVDLTRRITSFLELIAEGGALSATGRTNDAPDGPADTLGFFAYRNRGRIGRQNAGLRANAETAAGVFTVGVEWSRESQRSADSSNYDVGVNRFAAARTTRALFLQGAGERGLLSWTIGTRLDRNSSFGDFETSRAGAAIRLPAHVSVRASAGTAFKAPTFLETFSSAFSIGNPELVPEHSRSWDAGVEWKPSAVTALRATWFSQYFRDLIQYTYLPAPAPNYFNVAAASARGVELEAQSVLSPLVSARASVTLLRTRVDDAGFDRDGGAGATFVAGERLLRRPPQAATLTLLTPPSRGRSFNVGVTYSGARSDRDFSGESVRPVQLKAFTRLDAGGEWRFSSGSLAPRWSATARVENLLGSRYEEVADFPAPGRVVLIGVRVTTDQ